MSGNTPNNLKSYNEITPQEEKTGVDSATLGVKSHENVATVKTGELEDALEINPEELYNYFSQMKDEYLGKIMGKDEKFNERKDHLSCKYAMSKAIAKYGYYNVMKLKYFKDIQESIDNYDDYLSGLGEEIEDF